MKASVDDDTNPSKYTNVWIMLTNDGGDGIVPYPSS